MKYLLLSLVFLFAVSFAFPINNVMGDKNVESYNIENIEANVFGLCKYTLTWASGSSVILFYYGIDISIITSNPFII